MSSADWFSKFFWFEIRCKCNAAGGPGALAVGPPTLHGGPVRLRLVRSTPCFLVIGMPWRVLVAVDKTLLKILWWLMIRFSSSAVSSSLVIIISSSRPHRLHTTHRFGLLLQMSHVAWSVCLFACLFVEHTCVLCRNGLTDRDAVCGADLWGSNEPCVRWGPDLPTRESDRMTTRPFAKLLWKLVLNCGRDQTRLLDRLWPRPPT